MCAAAVALDHLWPDKIPEGLSAKERNNIVRDWLAANELSVPNDIAKAIQRALKARQLKKDKPVQAPASSRAAALAAADDKAFAAFLCSRLGRMTTTLDAPIPGSAGTPGRVCRNLQTATAPAPVAQPAGQNKSNPQSELRARGSFERGTFALRSRLNV
jgi:hypothetical protein